MSMSEGCVDELQHIAYAIAMVEDRLQHVNNAYMLMPEDVKQSMHQLTKSRQLLQHALIRDKEDA